MFIRFGLAPGNNFIQFKIPFENGYVKFSRSVLIEMIHPIILLTKLLRHERLNHSKFIKR